MAVLAEHYVVNRNVTDPRAVGQIITEAEARLADKMHPDPYIRALWNSTSECIVLKSSSNNDLFPLFAIAVMYPGGTK